MKLVLSTTNVFLGETTSTKQRSRTWPKQKIFLWCSTAGTPMVNKWGSILELRASPLRVLMGAILKGSTRLYSSRTVLNMMRVSFANRRPSLKGGHDESEQIPIAIF